MAPKPCADPEAGIALYLAPLVSAFFFLLASAPFLPLQDGHLPLPSPPGCSAYSEELLLPLQAIS